VEAGFRGKKEILKGLKGRSAFAEATADKGNIEFQRALIRRIFLLEPLPKDEI
jgi:hypothetical protein